MSVEYYYVNDLNRLYNAAVGDKTDGDEHHVRMIEAHDNLRHTCKNWNTGKIPPYSYQEIMARHKPK